MVASRTAGGAFNRWISEQRLDGEKSRRVREGGIGEGGGVGRGGWVSQHGRRSDGAGGDERRNEGNGSGTGTGRLAGRGSGGGADSGCPGGSTARGRPPL